MENFQLTCLHLAIWALVFDGVSEAVHITTFLETIRAKDSNCMVVLPCDFKTKPHATPQITWYQERGDGRTLVMRYDIYNNLQPFGEFFNRVARGDAGALILFRSTARDSGNYTCEVELHNENPSWMKSTVVLNVTTVPPTTEVSTRVSEGVHITSFPDPIRAKDSDCMAVLPCDFKTSTYETPQISWYHDRGDDIRLIMRHDRNNHLYSYGDFLDRVSRGDAGALVIWRPTSRDSGNYTCKVEVDNENPSWMKSTVVLKVTKDPLTTEASTRVPELNDQKAPQDMIILNAICWISPVICFLISRTMEITIRTQTFQKLRQKTPRQLLKTVAGPAVVVIALCLIFTGTLSTTVVLSSTTHDLTKYYRGVGIATGTTGILMLFVGTIICSVLPVNQIRKCTCPIRTSTDHDDETSNTCQTALSQGDGIPRVQISTVRSPGSTVEETASLISEKDVKTLISNHGRVVGHGSVDEQRKSYSHTERPKTVWTIIENPPGDKVTGMVGMTYKDVYLSTRSAVSRLDTREGFEKKLCGHLHSRDDHLVMITKYKNDLLVAARRNTPLKKRFSWLTQTSNSLILHQVLSEKKYYPIDLWLNSTLTWVLVGREEKWLYLAMSNPPMIHRMTIDKQEEISFGKDVLENPACIVQNSFGQLIVADSHKHDLLVFREDGSFDTSMKTCFPKRIEQELRGCNRLAIGPDDRIYASSPRSKDIVVFSADFRFESLHSTMAGESGEISCLLVHNNSLFVAYEDCIRVYPLDDDEGYFTKELLIRQLDAKTIYKL